MVVDTSVILAIFFEEPHGPWAAEQLKVHAGDLVMSTVNLTEALIRIRDRQPRRGAELEATLLSGAIRFAPPDIRQARIAALARLKFPLNLGDCFVYALAVVEDSAILSTDFDFERADRPVVLPPERPKPG